jgi:hypothetical protein
MGSNPIPSIVASVRIPDVKNNGTNDRKQNLRQKLKILLERSNLVSANSGSRNHLIDIVLPNDLFLLNCSSQTDF